MGEYFLTLREEKFGIKAIIGTFGELMKMISIARCSFKSADMTGEEVRPLLLCLTKEMI